jgi:hypothetical protein
VIETVKPVVVQSCEDDRWSSELLACMDRLTVTDDPHTCNHLFTQDQVVGPSFRPSRRAASPLTPLPIRRQRRFTFRRRTSSTTRRTAKRLRARAQPRRVSRCVAPRELPGVATIRSSCTPTAQLTMKTNCTTRMS